MYLETLRQNFRSKINPVFFSLLTTIFFSLPVSKILLKKLLYTVLKDNNCFQGFGGVVILLLSTAELNTFTAEVNQQAFRKTRLRWVISTLGGEPLAGQLSQDGVTECAHMFQSGACQVNTS